MKEGNPIKLMRNSLVHDRQRLDLSKYIEEHVYGFDQAFDEKCTNDQVDALSQLKLNVGRSTMTPFALWCYILSNAMRRLLALPMDKLAAERRSQLSARLVRPLERTSAVYTHLPPAISSN